MIEQDVHSIYKGEYLVDVFVILSRSAVANILIWVWAAVVESFTFLSVKSCNGNQYKFVNIIYKYIYMQYIYSIIALFIFNRGRDDLCVSSTDL